MIKDKVGRLCDTLSIFNKRGQIIELRHALTATIVDITTEFCTFAETAKLPQASCFQSSSIATDDVFSFWSMRKRSRRARLCSRMGPDDARSLRDCSPRPSISWYRTNRTSFANKRGPASESFDGKVLAV